MQDYREFLDEILVDEETLQRRIAELGIQISRDYQGKSLHLICILRGGDVPDRPDAQDLGAPYS